MDPNLEVLMRMMTTTLPIGITQLDLVIEDRFQKAKSTGLDSYLALSYEHGAHILIAVRNALITLSNTVHKSEDGSLDIRITSTGMAGLLRIAFEGLANFRWLTEPCEIAQIEARAFSMHFTQVSEAQKYYRELGDKRALAKFTSLLELEIEYGKSEGLLVESSERPGTFKCSGLANIPDTTSLCRAIKVPAEIVTEEIKASYSGMANGAFLYRWLSGNAHGMYWVNGFEETPEGTMKTKIPYWIMHLALGTSLAEIRALAEKL
jgi:hypothetical protein